MIESFRIREESDEKETNPGNISFYCNSCLDYFSHYKEFKASRGLDRSKLWGICN
jgi:hypothetical protein